MKIGFTGTQRGMTQKQKETFTILFDKICSNNIVNEFHHGDCIGSDKDAHMIVMNKNIPIIVHPPLRPQKRAFCENAVRILPKKEYLIRNHNIVNATDVLFATPEQYTEELRSGTWATIRYAGKQVKYVYVIYPDGSYIEHY
jgi:hypothetical protein